MMYHKSPTLRKSQPKSKRGKQNRRQVIKINKIVARSDKRQEVSCGIALQRKKKESEKFCDKSNNIKSNQQSFQSFVSEF